jgi:hypothetical protein
MKQKKLFLLGFFFCSVAFAQQKMELNSLNGFKNPAKNWSISGDAVVDISKQNSLSAKPGIGVLTCLHEQGKYGMDYELISDFEHGDLDIEFDFMLAKGSNSGLYLQGNYEIQLYDSWGKKTAKYNDCGGIYERWNDAKPDGEKGYEGYAPRVNAAKAPGLWQHMKVSFESAKFDANGKKISNAKILLIELNGMVLHENVELSGPTRGSLSANDVAKGPLRIQGDHGSLAIKNVLISQFEGKKGAISDVNYTVYYGSYLLDKDLSTLKKDAVGKLETLNYEFLSKPNDYVYVIKGTYNAPLAGKYTFKQQIGGSNYLLINGKEVIKNGWSQSGETRTGTVELTAGKHSFEIFCNKRDGWLKSVLGLWSAGPGFRETPHHVLASVISVKPSDPILLDAKSNINLRSFMDVEIGNTKKRIVHSISVGSASNLHYSYDLDKGALFQIWRGDFLDTTPMWNDRGDGSSRPRGPITVLGNDLALNLLNSNEQAWSSDTSAKAFKTKGYTLDENDVPTFVYFQNGTKIQDAIKVVEDKYFNRKISIDKESESLKAKIASAEIIEKISDTLYAINGKSYYIQLNQDSGNILLRTQNGIQELILSSKNAQFNYDILY